MIVYRNMALHEYIASRYYWVKEYLDFLKLYRHVFRNYRLVLRSVWKGEYPVNGVLIDGSKMRFSCYGEVFCVLFGMRYQDGVVSVEYDGQEIRFHGGTENGDLKGIFIENGYSQLPVEHRIVLDVGASIADSSIYFALRGAQKVIAFEPSPEICLLAQKNIRENRLSGRIILINGAVGRVTDRSRSPPVYALSDLPGFEDSTLLKMDCEGCEYDAILGTPESELAHFEAMQIEYHRGYCNLERKLQWAGYRVCHSRPHYHEPFSKGGARWGNPPSNMYLGTLQARKRGRDIQTI